MVELPLGSLFSEERSTGFQFWGFWRLATKQGINHSIGEIVNPIGGGGN